MKEDADAYDRLLGRLLGALSPPATGVAQQARQGPDSEAGEDGPADAGPEPSPLVALAIEELAELHWDLERERRIHHLLRQQRGWHRAQDLDDVTEAEDSALARTERPQDYLRGAMDRKLRLILALVREARQQAKKIAKQELGLEPDQELGREADQEPGREPEIPGEPRRSRPTRSAVNPAGATRRERIPDAKSDARNEGTNRGSPVDSTKGAVS